MNRKFSSIRQCLKLDKITYRPFKVNIKCNGLKAGGEVAASPANHRRFRLAKRALLLTIATDILHIISKTHAELYITITTVIISPPQTVICNGVITAFWVGYVCCKFV